MVYLKEMRANNKEKFWVCISQYAVLILWIAAALIIDWEKALLFVIIPQQVSLFSVLIFNYVQHVHADEESEWNHSRNFTGFLNFLLFNNGYHTIHHHKAGLHWKKAAEAHKEINDNINPVLLERSFWWYIIRSYFLSIFIPKFRTTSMRLERIKKESMKVVTGETQPELQVS
jgi:fatty acid desaturase